MDTLGLMLGFDLISHPANFIFAAFHIQIVLANFIFSIFNSLDFWNFIKRKFLEILENFPCYISSFLHLNECLLLKINKQTCGNLEFKSPSITVMDDSQAVCLDITALARGID